MFLLLALRSFIFYLGFYSSLLIYACLCLLIGPWLSIPKRYPFFLQWNHFIFLWLRLTCRIRVEILGQENIPSFPVVIVSNHQSPWETIFLYSFFTPVSAILKKELLSLPFFGWSLALLQPIAIDRSRKFKARNDLIQQGRDRFSKGISVLVFPEGTRVAPGVEKPYQSGAATLALETGAKILPVAHNAGYFWPSGKFLKHPGTIQVRIGPLIETDGKDARSLTREAEIWIKSAL